MKSKTSNESFELCAGLSDFDLIHESDVHMHLTADEGVRFDGIWAAFRFGMRLFYAAADQCRAALGNKRRIMCFAKIQF